ncbi:hypothetical protein BSK66_31255 [Paenibacillus odorifer]|uniref:Uncharacterized protein n=1 Tax=Paenibacillus odorifer TaxID=189426 RepID=A0A1R0X056_9BACL|nr:hypothetical protein BJP51_04260 [Paenibacillus odorifer]OME46921.1 hypothetical protein BSK66_31255 [Paenibacillus odorifer]
MRVSEDKRIEISLITGAKYNRKFYKASDKILILPSEVESLIKDGVIRREDVPELDDDEDEQNVPLEEMKLPALKKYAKEHGIDLGEASKIKEVLAVILKAGEADAGGDPKVSNSTETITTDTV